MAKSTLQNLSVFFWIFYIHSTQKPLQLLSKFPATAQVGIRSGLACAAIVFKHAECKCSTSIHFAMRNLSDLWGGQYLFGFYCWKVSAPQWASLPNQQTKSYQIYPNWKMFTFNEFNSPRWEDKKETWKSHDHSWLVFKLQAPKQTCDFHGSWYGRISEVEQRLKMEQWERGFSTSTFQTLGIWMPEAGVKRPLEYFFFPSIRQN